MTPSPRAATAGPASLIVREQKDLILSAMLCLGGICLVLQSWTLGLFVAERLSSKGSRRCFPVNLHPPVPRPPRPLPKSTARALLTTGGP